MSLISIILIALSLGVDSFCALLAIGATEKGSGRRRKFTMLATSIGIFHFFMPLLGWYFSSFLVGYVESFAGYIACGLFSILGLKMIKESFSVEPPCLNITFTKTLMLSLALSIDALVAGFSLSLVNMNNSHSIYLISAIFALGAFLMTVLGYYIGAKYCCFNARISYIIGGLVLIALGISSVL